MCAAKLEFKEGRGGGGGGGLRKNPLCGGGTTLWIFSRTNFNTILSLLPKDQVMRKCLTVAQRGWADAELTDG